MASTICFASNVPLHRSPCGLTCTLSSSEQTMMKSFELEGANRDTMPSFTLLSPRLSISILVTCVILFLLFQIRSLHQTPSSGSWALLHQWHSLIINTTSSACSSDHLHPATLDKLRRSITFLPLKDYRYSTTALEGHTWFMSSTYDTRQQKGEVQYQRFSSDSSDGRVLCLRGRDIHDGSWNSYAFALPEALPYNATFLKGLTFVSNNHYDYANIWHGLSATVPFIAWHQRNGCRAPDRWVLYHWGELRLGVGPWLANIIHATFGDPPHVDPLEGGDDAPFCFQDAVVTRHGEGGMSKERLMEAYDLIRQKARGLCNVTRESREVIGMTMLMRTGARSFRNETAVVGIFERECGKVEGCRLRVAYSSNLSFCEQVRVMGETDVLVSPHGAQLTNMFLMDRNSSVMEFFPKGWLKVAGVGQYVYHWIASWSGMKHQGAWRDADGDTCPYSEDDPRCMAVYKNGLIGFNETFFSHWAAKVLNEVRSRKTMEQNATFNSNNVPTCS